MNFPVSSHLSDPPQVAIDAAVDFAIILEGGR